MKNILTKTYLKYTLITCTALILFVGCNRSTEKVENAEENVLEAKENLAQAEDDYQMEVFNFKVATNEKITANEKLLEDLNKEIKVAKKELKATYQNEITKLEQKNAKMKQRMLDYKEDGNEKWQSFKSEYNHDMDELGRALKEFTVNNKK